jgi:gluconate 2-dehydrogenase gamma chain
MVDQPIPRRNFLKGAGVAGTAAITSLAGGLAACAENPPAPGTTAPAPAASEAAPAPPLALSPNEIAFVAAAVDTLIPADELSPSASQCGVVTFIDRQLASAWGGGAKMYRMGPFHKGTPEQGYQLPLSPREFFGAGIAAADAWSRKSYGKPFDTLAPEQRVAALKEMESGKAEFADLSSREFFATLLDLTMLGFFSDPLYGGNRDKAAWKMLGYPGLPATYADKIDAYRGKRYVAEPQSIADFS